MATMTFEEFQASKQREPLAVFEARAGIDMGDPNGGHILSYGPGNMLYISDYTEVALGGYDLLIGRDEWLDPDLEKLERILYQWALDEDILYSEAAHG